MQCRGKEIWVPFRHTKKNQRKAKWNEWARVVLGKEHKIYFKTLFIQLNLARLTQLVTRVHQSFFIKFKRKQSRKVKRCQVETKNLKKKIKMCFPDSKHSSGKHCRVKRTKIRFNCVLFFVIKHHKHKRLRGGETN